MGWPGGQPFGCRSLPSQLLICRCTKPFDRKENYKQHLMIITWPFPGFPRPIPVFLYPFPVLPRNSGFSQETCGFPGNFRFSVNTSWLFLDYPWKLPDLPMKLHENPLETSGYLWTLFSFKFSCANHSVFLLNPDALEISQDNSGFPKVTPEKW